MGYIVAKFGGWANASAENVKLAADLFEKNHDRKIKVNSAIGKVEELINLACDIVTDDETGANIQYMLCNFKTVARNYPNTEKGQLVRGKCDNLYDYHADQSYRSR